MPEKRSFTVGRFQVTPRCQEVHGGLENALMEAMRRAVPGCLEMDKHDCNRGAEYEVIVKMTRQSR